MKQQFFQSISRVFPDGRPTVESGALGTSPFRHLLLFLAFILLPMTGWGGVVNLNSATVTNNWSTVAGVGAVTNKNGASWGTPDLTTCSESGKKTGGGYFTVQTFTAINSLVITAQSTSNRTVNSVATGNAVACGTSLTKGTDYTLSGGDGNYQIPKNTCGNQFTIAFKNAIPANNYVKITLSGNADIVEVEFVGAGPTDPTIEFRDTTYEIGSGNLDLTKLFKSDSEGTVTYSLYAAGTTATASVSGSTFTASVAGTAQVIAAQAEESGKFNAKNDTNTITVTAAIQKYAVTFAANGGTGEMTALQKAAGVEVTLPACTFTAPAGKAFDKWTSTDVEIENGKFDMPAKNVTVTATYKKAPTILFHYQWTGSGTQPSIGDQLIATGGKINVLRKTGSDKTLGNESATFDSSVPADMRFSGTSSSKGIKFITGDVYFELKLNSGTFEEGDTIFVSGYEQFIVCSSAAKAESGTGDVASSIKADGASKTAYKVAYAIIPQDISVSSLYLRRNSNSACFAAVKVIRPAAKEPVDTVIDLKDVKADGTSIPAAKLSYLKAEGVVTLDGTFTSAPEITFVERTTITFDDESQKVTTKDVKKQATSAVGGKYTVSDTIAGTGYTVHATAVAAVKAAFYDGTKKLGVLNVEYNTAPIAAQYKPFEEKTLATFNGWYLDSEFQTAADMSAAITDSTTYFGKWTTAYAQSIDMEKFVIENTKKGDYTTFITSKNWQLSNAKELDSLNNAKPKNNAPYLGLKFNSASGEVLGNITAGKLVTIKTGNMPANGARIVLAEAKDTVKLTSYSDSLPKVSYMYTENADVLKFQTLTGSTTMLKAILVTDPYVVTYTNGGTIDPMTFKGTPLTLPNATGEGEFQGWFSAETGGTKVGMNGDKFVPFSDTTLYAQFSAKSTDNSLKTLKYGETSITIVAEQTEYAVNLPYKTAIPATVTYEANSPVATPTGEQSANVVDGVASFTITAESGDAATYTVTFTVAPKDPLCIVKTATTGSKTQTLSGLYADMNATNMVNLGSDMKLGGKSNYIGVQMVSTQKFKEGDIINIHTTTAAQQGNIAIYSNTGESATKIADLSTGFGVLGDNKFALPAGVESYNTLYICRTSANSWNGYVDFVEVDRPMNPVLTALTVAGETATIDEANKTISVALPNGTVPSTAEFVPTIVANCDNPTAVLDGTLAYNTPINYYIIDKDKDTTTYVLTATEKALPAAVPTITTNPVSAQYYDTATVIAPLTVVATVTDAGTLSYKWYKEQEGDDAQVGTGASYTPTAAGSYYAIATNTLGTETASATSNVAVITITHLYTFKDWDGTSTTFTKVGEWTMYSSANSGKEIATTTTFKANQDVNKAGDKANVNQTQYVTVVFAKDMKAVQLVAYNSSSRSLSNIYTLNVDAKKLTEVTSSYTKSSSQDATTKVSTMDATGHFESGVYYVFKISSSCNVFDFFTTAAAIVSGPTASIVSGTIDEEPFSESEIATLNSAKALTLTTKFVAEPEIQLVQHTVTTYDDEFVKTVKDTVDAVVTTVGTNFIATCTFGSQDYVITCPINTDPVLELNKTAGTIALQKLVRTLTDTITLAGLNLTDGVYKVNMPTVAGLSIAPASFTVTDGAVDQEFVVTYASEANVAEAVANIQFVVGAISVNYQLTYSSVAALEQVSVSETTVWNWTNAASQSIKLTDLKNVEVLMANIAGVNNDANFNSQALIFYGENVKATDGGVNYASIGHIKFTTTIPGVVTVEFADNGSNNRRLMINDAVSESSASKTDYKTFSASVNAGEVTLMGVKPDKTGTNQYIRIRKITFTAATRVNRNDLKDGMITGFCMENNVTAFWGAKFYYLYQKAADESYIELASVDTLKEGYPYIMIAEGKDVYYMPGTVTADEATNYNGLYGTFVDQPLGDGYCIILNNKYYRTHDGNNNGCYAHRAYLKLDEVSTTAQPAPGEQQVNVSARRIRLGSAEAQTVTGFDAILMDAEGVQKMVIDNQVVIIRGGKMYNAQGALMK